MTSSIELNIFFISNLIVSNPNTIKFNNTILKCGEFNRNNYLMSHDIFNRNLLYSEIKKDSGYSTSKKYTNLFLLLFIF